MMHFKLCRTFSLRFTFVNSLIRIVNRRRWFFTMSLRLELQFEHLDVEQFVALRRFLLDEYIRIEKLVQLEFKSNTIPDLARCALDDEIRQSIIEADMFEPKASRLICEYARAPFRLQGLSILFRDLPLWKPKHVELVRIFLRHVQTMQEPRECRRSLPISTFLNRAIQSQLPVKLIPIPHATTPWLCTMCTLVNDHKTVICDACGDTQLISIETLRNQALFRTYDVVHQYGLMIDLCFKPRARTDDSQAWKLFSKHRGRMFR
jgi:hypothetical protein